MISGHIQQNRSMYLRRKLLFYFIFITFASLFSSCASLSAYGRNRIDDFSDILTVGVEKESVGASVWLGCFGGGLHIASGGTGFGLRGGHLGLYRMGIPDHPEYGIETGRSVLLFNSRAYRASGDASQRSIDKNYAVHNIFFIKITMDDTDLRSCGQIEVALGIYGGLRIGLDIFEIVDFLAGLVTLDLMGDDINTSEPTAQSNPR